MKNIIFLACSALVLAGLWFFLKPAQQVAPDEERYLVEFQFQLQQGVLKRPQALVVRQGFPVRISLLSDRDDRLHLHGYELWVDVQANIPAILEFPATYSGRFELELHSAELQLGYLEVQPF